MQKVCKHCNRLLPLDSFSRLSGGVHGRATDCKECFKRHIRTEIGLVKSMLRHQKRASKVRNYSPPCYDAYELYAWIKDQPAFTSMYKAWVESNYDKNIMPSIDRINDRISYTLDNIQLSTVQQNIQRYNKDTFHGVNTKHNHAVDMLDLNGNFIQRFHSVAAAARHIGATSRINIHDVCDQKTRPVKRPDGTYYNYARTQAYGYKWRYSMIPHDNSEII